MFLINSLRKTEREIYNDQSADFVPIACHYDKNTLLTKNGELIQIIQINGLNSEKIGAKLLNLRETIRQALKPFYEEDDFAFWIHTIRKKTNLDDDSPYGNEFSEYLHESWRKKNYWGDKFVNTLYLSVVYDSPDVKVKDFRSFQNSLSKKTTAEFHKNYFEFALKKLNSFVDSMLKNLEEYGAQKLGIRFNGNEILSDPGFLYGKILHLIEEDLKLPAGDLSSALSSGRYAVGGDKIEVIDEAGKRFTSIISIKEYSTYSPKYLDAFLRLPVEFIATEIFFPTDSRIVADKYRESEYFLKISKDEDMIGIKDIANPLESGQNFCRQQLSIAIIAEDLSVLDEYIARASETLSEIGVVHVREDIKLEHAFWAQLPGNFNFIRRLNFVPVKDLGALASLQDFPAGVKYCPWGRQVTILRTEKGTPYFFNFHTRDGKNSLCLFGGPGSGKTILLNFLLSESTKFKPSVLILSGNGASSLFVKASGGIWVDDPFSLFNPFAILPDPSALEEFLKILCSGYAEPLDKENLDFLKKLSKKISGLPEKDKNFDYLLKKIDFAAKGGERIKKELEPFAKGGRYETLFSSENVPDIPKNGIFGVNLYKFSRKYFKDKYYPSDKKLIKAFEADSAKNDSVKIAFTYALSFLFFGGGGERKIYLSDSLYYPDQLRRFAEPIKALFSECVKNSIISLSSVETNLADEGETEPYKDWLELNSLKIIFPYSGKFSPGSNPLNLTKEEKEKLSLMKSAVRSFLMKGEDGSVAAELSIGGWREILKILSSKPGESSIYDDLKAKGEYNLRNLLELLKD